MNAVNKSVVAALACLALISTSNGAECTLDHASYTEERSGAVLQFHAKDVATEGITVMGLFDLRLPNIKTIYRGEIAWNMGRYARPDGSVAQPCTTDEAAEVPSACWLWTGPVYAIGNQTAVLIEEPDMAAPNILLFAEFGRALLMNETFGTANPDLFAFDVFMLNGCPGE
jgi:hypothetical protein